MADLTAIRDALAAQITNKTGLRADGQARDSVNPPCAVVLPGNPYVTYADTMDGALTVNLSVLLVISDGAPADATQRALDAYLGIGSGVTGSVPEAIAADPTLSGAVQWCQPAAVSQYGRIQWAGVDYFGAHLSVTAGTI